MALRKTGLPGLVGFGGELVHSSSSVMIWPVM